MGNYPRHQVYAAIDREREYQETRWGRDDARGIHMLEFVVFMEHYLALAKASGTKSSGPNFALHEAMNEIRKVAALAVACMEQCGVLPRNPLD